MLDIQRNRLNYGKLLAPPESFELTNAIGTTYSLDLYALLAIPISLFYAKNMEGDFHLNRYDVLDAIRKSKNKVDIFCQRGKILVPKEYNNLLAFMEDCIQEIQPSIVNASFHPKLWILRFENQKEVIYRLIVLSRNLTFDRSWDIAYYADGKPTNNEISESRKLSVFLKELYKDSNRKISSSFLEELSKVEFEIPFDFSDFKTFPILPFNKQNKELINPILNFKYKELLVISPFIDKNTIINLKKDNQKITLLSRQEELDKIDDNTLKEIDTYCMNELAVNGENYADTEGHEPKSQNLHAKIYIGENKKYVDLYMGSANCTSPAFDRNTEMLVKISTNKANYRLENIKNNLFSENQKFFIPYVKSSIMIDEEKESLEKKIRALTHELCGLVFTGFVSSDNINQNKDLIVNVDLTNFDCNGFDIKIAIPHKKEAVKDLNAGRKNSLLFSNIAITNLSQYLVLSFYYKNERQKGILIKMDINIPEEREDLIFNRLINSKDKFYQYLQFLLSPNDLRNILEITSDNLMVSQTTTELQKLFGMNSSIYEDLMIAASRDPNKLKEIDNVITKLKQIDSEVIKDFMPIWKVFKEFAND